MKHKTAIIPHKRRAASSFLKWTGVLGVANRIQPSSLTIFGCHRIQRPDQLTRFDDGVFDTPQAGQFKDLMKTLAQNGDAVSEKDIADFAAGRMKLPKRAFLVTFDDGYEDCHSLVTPVLKSLSISGLFFIPTEAIDDRKLGWWDLLAWSLKHSKRTEITVRDKRYALGTETEQALCEFKQIMKLECAQNNHSLVEEVAKACEVSLPALDLASKELLTWDQIRSMKKDGMAIGSHTHTHRVLATLPPETQREELALSKKRLETELGESVLSISYPVGGYEHFNLETKNLAKECGYQIGFSYHTGVNFHSTFDPFDIKRIAAPHHSSELLATLALPRIFARRACALDSPAAYST